MHLDDIPISMDGSGDAPPPPRRMLLLLFDPAGVRELEIGPPGVATSLGRASTSDFHLEHNSVSRTHATLRRGTGDTLFVEDHGSANGTFVNQHAVQGGAMPVAAGDDLRFGFVSARVRLLPEPTETSARIVTPRDLDSLVAREGSRAVAWNMDVSMLGVQQARPTPELAERVASLLGHADTCTLRKPGQCEAVLPGRTKDRALEVADCIRGVLHQDNNQVRIGVATFPGDAPTAGALAAAAVMAMRSAGQGHVRASRNAIRSLRSGHDAVVAGDPASLRVMAALERVAPTNRPVLIEGEPGSGRTTHARLVHELSPRRLFPLVQLDCRDETMDTGRLRAALERATGSTLLLEELSALARDLQRLLADARDVRLVATMSETPRQAVKENRLERALCWKLTATHIELPALRHRRGDIALLAQHILGRQRKNDQRLPLSPDARATLTRHAWPGNLTELEGVLVRAVAGADDVITAEDLAVGSDDSIVTSAKRSSELRDEPTQLLPLPDMSVDEDLP